MSRPSLGRTLAVVVVSLILATPWCSAAPRKAPSPAQASRPTTSTLPDLARHLWGRLTERWAKVGCSIDPGGLLSLLTCEVSPTPDSGIYQSNGDVGCSLDPGGLGCGGQ
jgi:hypothetical protein